MQYGVLLGSNLLVGTSGVITVVEDDGSQKEFFRIRELHRVRSEGAYIVVDCDIKDAEGNREIKLAKSRPVVVDPEVSVDYTKEATTVLRTDGSVVIRIELLSPDDESIPPLGPPMMRPLIAQKLREMDGLVRITGSFYAGSRHLELDNEQMRIGGALFVGNVSMNSGGIRIGARGVSF